MRVPGPQNETAELNVVHYCESVIDNAPCPRLHARG